MTSRKFIPETSTSLVSLIMGKVESAPSRASGVNPCGSSFISLKAASEGSGQTVSRRAFSENDLR